MPTDATKKDSEAEAADGKTQQMPLVQGPAKASADKVQPARLKGASDERVTAEVPQETVPMQAVAWPPPPAPPSADDTAPTRPPPLRGKVKESHAGTPNKGAEVSSRPGLFTAELRRALPPWAMPLLTFQPFSVWLGSRLALGLLAVLAGIMIPSSLDLGRVPDARANWYGSPTGPQLNPLVDSLAGVWTRWDGQWYLKIATEGYRADDGSAAFFPLYPWSVKVFGWLAGERYIWAGTLLSALFFLAALVLLHRLVRLDFHPKDAHRTILYTAAFPMAFFFWAVYSESLFLFLAVATLLAARAQRWWWAATAVSFAIWTRTTGLLLLLPLAWEMWRVYSPPRPTSGIPPDVVSVRETVGTRPASLPRKDPSTGLLLELLGFLGFLGIGHIWAGKTLRGILLMFGYWAFIVVLPFFFLFSGSIGNLFVLLCVWALAVLLIPILSGVWLRNEMRHDQEATRFTRTLTPDAMPPRRPSTLMLASFALPALSLLGLLAWSAAAFGKPLGALSAQEAWNRQFSWPWQTIAGAFRAVTQMEFKFQLENQSWTYLGALILAVGLGVLSIRWLRGSYSIYLWAGIIFPLFSVTPNDPLLSYPRFLIVLFPMFIVLALLGRNRYAHQVIIWLSMMLLALYTIRFVNWYWVA